MAKRMIEMQAVNDFFVKLQQDCFKDGHLDEWFFLVQVAKEFNKIPFVEPEPLTDKEQRMFLAAMRRERKVARQVDEEWKHAQETYEDTLIYVCNEIERKVKGALWPESASRRRLMRSTHGKWYTPGTRLAGKTRRKFTHRAMQSKNCPPQNQKR